MNTFHNFKNKSAVILFKKQFNVSKISVVVSERTGILM